MFYNGRVLTFVAIARIQINDYWTLKTKNMNTFSQITQGYDARCTNFSNS